MLRPFLYTGVMVVLCLSADASLAQSNPFDKAAAGTYAGRFGDRSLTAFIDKTDDGFRGTLMQGPQTFELQARVEQGQLVGSFSRGDESWPLRASLDGQSLRLELADRRHRLPRMNLRPLSLPSVSTAYASEKGSLKIEILMDEDRPRRYSGTLRFGDSRYTFAAEYRNDKLVGLFAADGDDHKFEIYSDLIEVDLHADVSRERKEKFGLDDTVMTQALFFSSGDFRARLNLAEDAQSPLVWATADERRRLGGAGYEMGEPVATIPSVRETLLVGVVKEERDVELFLIGRAERIASLLAEAKANDSEAEGKTALAALGELLRLDPDHHEAERLREKIAWYDVPVPSKVGETITNSVGMKLTYIPSGEFLMGSPRNEERRDDDETQHKVKISKPFLMGVTEVTQGQWEAVMGTDVREQRDKIHPDFSLRGEGADRPIYYVSWEEAVRFCEKLSEREGRTYRLPTESEWEYACRAGTTTPYSFGDDADDVDRYGNSRWGDDGHDETAPVGSFKPNRWGLYDMHGNLWEWCSDWYAEDYPRGEGTDPSGPGRGEDRVERGGCYFSPPLGGRAADRRWSPPDFRSKGIGFRAVCDLPRPGLSE